MSLVIAMPADNITIFHRGFDDCKFLLACKNGQGDAFHRDYIRMYHNRPVDIPRGVSMEFILARFAWAIFPLDKAFMEQGPDRLVRAEFKSKKTEG